MQSKERRKKDLAQRQGDLFQCAAANAETGMRVCAEGADRYHCWHQHAITVEAATYGTPFDVRAQTATRCRRAEIPRSARPLHPAAHVPDYPVSSTVLSAR